MAEAKASGVDLVVFDCDGVLVDSEPIAVPVLGRALRAAGLALADAEVHRTFVGLAFPRCVEIAELRLGHPLPSGFTERVQAETFDAFRDGLRAMPGIEETLDRLTVPYCVASSGDPDKLRLSLGLTGLLERFRGRTFSASEVPRGKPAPDLFLHAAARLGARPARTVVVEDSLPGVRAAVEAGMRVYGYAPAGDCAALQAAGAIPLLDLRELPGLLEEGS